AVEDLADNAAAEGHHADDEDQADHHGDGLTQHVEPVDAGPLRHGAAEFAHLVFEHDDNQRAQDGPQEGAQATDEGHEDHQPGHLPCGIRQSGRDEHQRLRGARQTGKRGRNHENQQLELRDVIPQGNGAGLVFAQGLEHLTERRVHRAPADDETQDEDDHDQVVQVEVVRQVDAEDAAPGNALQTVLTVSEGSLEEVEEDHLGHGQRDHGEVDAAATYGHGPHDHAQHGRDRGAEEQAQ